jgi:hypothetical protein
MSDIATTAESPPRSPLSDEVARRRTFAIISHPDAGKTTLTEKLLLFGGAINLAGQVKAKGERRNTRSDWMKIERERGISVVTSVMTFEFQDLVFNLLDARHSDHHLHQQDGPREPRHVRPLGRDRKDAGARYYADDLAGRPRPRFPRHL